MQGVQKKKPHSQFYAGQADCKECSHDAKNVLMAVKRQNELEWFGRLSEHEKDALRKAYSKEKEKCDKERGRVRFNIKKYKEEVEARQGVRFEGRRRFMTQKQFMKHARSEEGGLLVTWQSICCDCVVPSRVVPPCCSELALLRWLVALNILKVILGSQVLAVLQGPACVA